MNCEKFQHLLQRHTADSLPERAKAQLEAHGKHCAACQRDYAAAQQLWKQVAALPDRLSPERNLWPGIETAIRNSRDSVPARTPHFAWRLAIGMAAVACILALYAPVHRMLQAPVPSPAEQARAELYQSIEETEIAAQALRTELQAMIAKDAIALSPDTLAVIEENLAVLEGAVAEIQLALESSPDDPDLLRMLVAMREKEMQLIGKATRYAYPEEAAAEAL